MTDIFRTDLNEDEVEVVFTYEPADKSVGLNETAEIEAIFYKNVDIIAIVNDTDIKYLAECAIAQVHEWINESKSERQDWRYAA